MSTYRRAHISGGTFFFTVNLARRGSDTLTARVGKLRTAYQKTWVEMPFRTEAIVILPDHLHAVWRLPPGDAAYSERWRRIKARFSHGADAMPRSDSKVAKRERGIWQRRFWEHAIRDEADFDAHVRYCWGNPVKHGLVQHPVDWPYSSFHRDVRKGRVAAEWCGACPVGDFGE